MKHKRATQTPVEGERGQFSYLHYFFLILSQLVVCRVWLPSLNKAQEGFLFEPSPPALFVYQYSAYLYGSTGCAQADKRYKEMQVCKQEGARAVRFFAVCFLVNVGV